MERRLRLTGIDSKTADARPCTRTSTPVTSSSRDRRSPTPAMWPSSNTWAPMTQQWSCRGNCSSTTDRKRCSACPNSSAPRSSACSLRRSSTRPGTSRPGADTPRTAKTLHTCNSSKNRHGGHGPGQHVVHQHLPADIERQVRGTGPSRRQPTGLRAATLPSVKTYATSGAVTQIARTCRPKTSGSSTAAWLPVWHALPKSAVYGADAQSMIARARRGKRPPAALS